MTTNLPSLYILTGEYVAAAERMAELDLPEEVVRDTLEGLAGDLETKSTNVAMIIRNFEATVEAMDVAQAQMTVRKNVYKNKIERMKDYLHSNMVRAGISNIECPQFALSIRKNPPRVEITQPELIPDEYMRMPPVPMPEPDKAAIKKALQAGTEVPGCGLKTSTSLQIK